MPSDCDQPVHRHLDRAEGGLGDVGCGQRLARTGLVVLAVGGTGEDEAAQPRRFAEAAGERLAQHPVGLGQRLGADREVQRQLAQHAGVLRALSGEEDGELAGRSRADAVMHARRQRPGVAAESRQREVELGHQVGAILGDDRDRLLRGAPATGEAGGEVAQGDARMAREVGAKRCEPAYQGSRIRLAPQQQLGRPTLGRRLAPACAEFAAILFHHNVEVGAAETEGAGRGTARNLPGLEPGDGLIEQVERAGRCRQDRVGLLDVEVRRQHAMVQGQRRLDQPGDACGGLGVADHRLDRADRRLTRRDPLGADELGGALQLGAVAGDGAGAVRLEQTDARRPEPGHLVRAAHRPQLARRQRRGQALGVAVAAAADALDHRIDPVAIALGIGQALERDHRDALGDHDAVARGIEGRAATARRKRLGFAEAEVAERSLDRIDAAGDDEVAAAGHQFGDALVDRSQRRGAGGVDGEVDAAEIEPVRDPAGDDVEQDAGEGVLGPLGQPVGDLGRQRAAEAWQLRAQTVLRADVAGATAGADDHRGALAVESLLVIAGILDRLPRHLERHQLHRIDGGDRLRRHAVAHRIEHDVVEETAPFRIDLVLGGAVGVEIEAPVPAVRRNLGDRVDLVEDVLPVLAGRVRLG